MPTIQNSQLRPARIGIRRLLDYEHPVSLRGLNNDVTREFIVLDDELRGHGKTLDEQLRELRKRYGTPKGDDFEVTKDNPRYAEFVAEATKVLAMEIEVTHTIKRSKCWVGDENGEHEQANPRGSVWLDLGPLVVEDEKSENGNAATPRKNARKSNRARR